MADPVSNPLSPEDVVYGDEGPAARSADPKRQADAEAFERRRDREHNELASVLSGELGQAFIMRMLDFCGPYRSTISFGHPDASAFDEGKRAVALWLIDKITRIDPDMYATMLMAHVKRKRALISVETGITKAQ